MPHYELIDFSTLYPDSSSSSEINIENDDVYRFQNRDLSVFHAKLNKIIHEFKSKYSQSDSPELNRFLNPLSDAILELQRLDQMSESVKGTPHIGFPIVLYGKDSIVDSYIEVICEKMNYRLMHFYPDDNHELKLNSSMYTIRDKITLNLFLEEMRQCEMHTIIIQYNDDGSLSDIDNEYAHIFELNVYQLLMNINKNLPYQLRDMFKRYQNQIHKEYYEKHNSKIRKDVE